MTSPDTVPTVESVAGRGFNVNLPDGFMELPVDGAEATPSELPQELVDQMATTFGLARDDENARAAAGVFSVFGTTAGEQGADYVAVAFYKSPDDPLRPIMIAVTGLAVASDHNRPETALAGITELHSGNGPSAPRDIQLPVGRAVVTVHEETNDLALGEETFEVHTRKATLWVPDPDGTTLGVVSVMTNSWQDWERVCTVALDIFDSFEWLPLVAD